MYAGRARFHIDEHLGNDMSIQSWAARARKRYVFRWISRQYHYQKITALRDRYTKGTKKAFALGYAQADSDKRHRIEIAYTPAQPLDSEDSIVASTKLPIKPHVIARFEANLKERNLPTPDQCDLIYSRNRSTCVIAGAGSGKSTTLVLRVLMLHKELGIPLDQITVISFTRASCAEFREKIIKVFAAHGIEVTEEKAKSIVRTFHSKILELSRGTVLKPGFQFFEFVDDKNTSQTEDDHQSELDTKLNDPQRTLLKEAYTRLYSRNTTFRTLIKQLHMHSLRQELFAGANANEPSDIEKYLSDAAARDLEYTRLVDSVFPLMEPSEYPLPVVVTISGHTHTFYANRYIPDLDLYVAFTPAWDTITSRMKQGEDWPNSINGTYLGIASNHKRQLLQRNTHIVVISNDEEFHAFEETLKHHQNVFERAEHEAPLFKFRVTGEIKAADIWEALYQFGGFIENAGMEVRAFENAETPLWVSEIDSVFLKALCHFWPVFDAHLEQHSLLRFHHSFAYFSERNPESYATLTEDKLRSMSHILIDEFQDISPEIVQWIRGMLRYMKNRHMDTSLMVVGDDDQSIYGWRGSAPQFITDFDTHFPTDKGSEKVSMTDNFRSHQEIVDAGECMLEGVIGRDPYKHGVCAKGEGGLVKTTLKKDIEVVSQRLVDLYHKFRSLPPEERDRYKKSGDTFVLVLSRINNSVTEIRKKVLQKLSFRSGERIPEYIISFMTFHRSKGLEADYCILLDDCVYDNTHPLKNFVYASTGTFEQTYDEAQRDEAKRLAYVALTRAKKVSCWYADPKKSMSAIARLDARLGKNRTPSHKGFEETI